MQSSIQLLEIAPGLKDLLIKSGFFTVDSIAISSPPEIASALQIDVYIAKIIFDEASKVNKRGILTKDTIRTSIKTAALSN
jgi:hypothetical protein